MIFKIAFRNIRRNTRRSAMTVSTIAIGAIALLVFGAFVADLIAGYQTLMVRRLGHLSVFHTGYFEFGTGNPAAYGIDDYKRVIALLSSTPELAPMVNVVSPTIILTGIAGNFGIDASKTIFGVGVVPSDRDRMLRWNQYELDMPPPERPTLLDGDEALGVVGSGLARILGLCESLGIADCPRPPPRHDPSVGTTVAEDFSGLAPQPVEQDRGHDGMPRIDVLAATTGGAPNVVSIFVRGAEVQGIKELDDSYVGMHLSLAQKLLYGRGDRKATSIVLQLNRTDDLDAARQRLLALFTREKLDLEVRDFTELVPMYKGVIGMFGSIFSFVAVIMGLIVVFSVVNTMSMTVMERTNEIGTLRAMGVRRGGVRQQFLTEGWLLGVIGATLGVVLAMVVTFVVNRSGLTWTPPISAKSIPLKLMLEGQEPLILGTWLGLVALATFAALIPARRAARMLVVDALRHV